MCVSAKKFKPLFTFQYKIILHSSKIVTGKLGHSPKASIERYACNYITYKTPSKHTRQSEITI